MFLASLLMLALQTAETPVKPPAYFLPVVVFLAVGGTIGWLVAAVLGFARARAFGPSTRWFAFASVCMIIFQLMFFMLAIGVILNNPDLTLGVGAFFFLFPVLAAVCSIFGFVKLTNPR
ncbi:MAG: hypothetical protein WBP93_18570 [Pyrinomonadaceae bacterium]